MVEKIKEQVEALEDKAKVNMNLIGTLYGDQARQDFNVVPRLEKLEEAMEKKKMTNKEKRRIGIKESILVTTFIGFIASFLFFMWMFETEDVQYLKIILSIWMVFWAIIMVFGFSKGSIMAFGAALIKVATDKTMTTEEKLAMIMIIIQEWLNIAANWSQIINVENKEKLKEKKALEKELKDLKK